MTIAEILADPSTSFWLRDAIAHADNRDLVDALIDAQTLALALQAKFDALTLLALDTL